MVRLSFVALTVGLLLAACGSSPAIEGDVVEVDEGGGFERVALDDVALWRHAEPSPDGLGAEIAGVVEHDGTCGAVLHDEAVDVRYPVVWPNGTTIFASAPLQVQLPDGTTVRQGQRVSGGGGYLSDLGLVPEACAATGETAVFNPSDAVRVD